MQGCRLKECGTWNFCSSDFENVFTKACVRAGSGLEIKALVSSSQLSKYKALVKPAECRLAATHACWEIAYLD